MELLVTALVLPIFFYFLAHIRDFLAQINQGGDWRVHCLRFAPYAPKENPIENVWGQLKQTLRQMYLRCRSFKFTTLLFEMLV